ncbi:protein ALTERED PHOSPHATE STARVATION RESPONSE 1-like [Zingiber officinale]|uniref:Nitrate regulatory gene2 protein n=1 Tax=Zingiber officinale TaxID=94328 RepID=A0A8J5CEX4_ZINOF|nr:protein ALTERED PHOSPHATE STARVATION RESPONSE 1-like [Zingiber officinale]KAG6474159.1 hypothetical protein ZIOFF_068083 [Zingiber officinale]
MGCWHSRLERQEVVSRCKARRRYMKHLVQGRRDFALAHSLYLRSLRATGAALLQFANAETYNHNNNDHHHLPLLSSPSPSSSPPPLPSPPPPPTPPAPQPPASAKSPISDNWTSSLTASSPILHPPPPPPPSSSWDFWDPFVPSFSRSATEECEEVTTTVSEVTVAPAAVPPPAVASSKTKDITSERTVVVIPRANKDLSEIVKELDEYFLKAAEAGRRVSFILEAPNSDLSFNQGIGGKMSGYGKNLNPLHWSWRSNSKTCGDFTGFGNCGEGMRGDNGSGSCSGVAADSVSHTSTVEKLYAWEKKLYLEVKNAETIKEEHEKRVALLRKQEAKGVDYMKVEKNKMEIESLESKMMVASQAIETTSSAIIKLREVELFPQLLELVTGLMTMWRSMYECHQVQTHIVQQLEYLNCALSSQSTSDALRQAALQLELEVDRWYSSFCSLIKSQREYIYALAGWLRLSLFQCHHDPLTKCDPNSEIYSLSEEWQLAFDRIPDKVASEGIKSFLTVINAIVVQQSEEQKQKKRSEAAFKELEKRSEELRSMESKYGLFFEAEGHSDVARRSLVVEKRAKVEALKTKAEEEKSKYEKSVGVTRAMTLNNLQTGFPNIFQAMTGFASVCMQAFESLYNHHRCLNQILDPKRLLA